MLKTARKLDVNVATVFTMRHKLLNMMEMAQESVILDETFVKASHKSLSLEELAGIEMIAGRTKRGLSKQRVCIACGVNNRGEAFARSFGCGILGRNDAMNLSPYIENSSSITTDGNGAYERLIRGKNCIHQTCSDCTAHKASINLNRINSFHSKIKGYYRTYRGVASKYINRYAAFFSLAWKLRKLGVEDLIKKVRDMILDLRLFLSLSDLREYRLFTPDDIEWRPAS